MYAPFELPEYREHFIELSNASLLKVGVCTACHMTLISGVKASENAGKILEAYKRWLRGIQGQKSDFENLEIINPNASESDYQMNRLRAEMREKSNLENQKQSHYEEIDQKENARIREDAENENKKREFDEAAKKQREELKKEELEFSEKVYKRIVLG